MIVVCLKTGPFTYFGKNSLHTLTKSICSRRPKTPSAIISALNERVYSLNTQEQQQYAQEHSYFERINTHLFLNMLEVNGTLVVPHDNPMDINFFNRKNQGEQSILIWGRTRDWRWKHIVVSECENVLCIVSRGVIKLAIAVQTKDLLSNDNEFEEVQVPLSTYGSKKQIWLSRRCHETGYWETSECSLFNLVYGVYTLQSFQVSC